MVKNVNFISPQTLALTASNSPLDNPLASAIMNCMEYKRSGNRNHTHLPGHNPDVRGSVGLTASRPPLFLRKEKNEKRQSN